jgi:protein ImuB
LVAVAHQFAHAIETLEHGILFDVSGLQRLIGKPDRIAQNILGELKKNNIPGSVAVADTVETAALIARQNGAGEQTLHSPETFQQIPLCDLNIEQDTLNVFSDLGINRVEDLLDVPQDDLVNRYGREFESVIRTIRQKGDRLLTPNVKESRVSWSYQLDHAVEDFEQLIFLLNHGLDILFTKVSKLSLSTEHLDISFKLSNRTSRSYEIKTSFPTFERSFWLKLINLRISLDPPEAGITAVDVTSHFTKPRPSQKGLYAVSRPSPENLLLTVNKLKKLVGEQNVGVPVILNERLAEAFKLDADAMPQGSERIDVHQEKAVIAFSYFHPPVRAEALIRDGRLVFLRTRFFSGYVVACSGVWKANSKWWERSWKTREWDVEIENQGVYRLCKAGEDWFLVGEYD